LHGVEVAFEGNHIDVVSVNVEVIEIDLTRVVALACADVFVPAVSG
jgi:hypothetical protein